jgi:hypothetical protein
MSTSTKTLDTIALFRGVATSIHAGVTAIDMVNGSASVLREAKIVFGKSVKTCQYRLQFADAMKAAFKGKTQKTYSNYMTSFVAAVNDGTPFSLSSSKSSTKGKGAKGTKAGDKSATDKMLSALLNVWKLSEVGEDVLVQVETAMADGSTLIDAIEYVLESNGTVLNKGDDK